MEKSPILKIENLNIAFEKDQQKLRAVRNISFDLHSGEILGIIGESGCGKSITALSLLRLIPSNQGTIEMDAFYFQGENIANYTNQQFKSVRGKRISIIFQEPMTALNPVMKIFHQLLEAIRRNPKIPPKDYRDYAEELLLKMGLSDVNRILESYPHELSGGMKQRVLIAMALACDPEILIADEPTTALDLTVQAQILNLLLELREKRKLSILFITHDLGIVSHLCDRVLVMYAGKIVEEGPTGAIFHNPSHPYTKGLLNSILHRKKEPKQKLNTIEGNVPSLDEIPEGCTFQNRCPYVQSICKTGIPVLKEIQLKQYSACFFQPPFHSK